MRVAACVAVCVAVCVVVRVAVRVAVRIAVRVEGTADFIQGSLKLYMWALLDCT